MAQRLGVVQTLDRREQTLWSGHSPRTTRDCRC